MPVTIRLDSAGVVQGSPFKSPRFAVHLGDVVVPVSEQGYRLLASDVGARRTLISCATSFRSFLDHWAFVPEGHAATVLGLNLWSAQEAFVRATEEHASIYALKARQLGESTIACAFDGWRLRFGPPNARVSVLSQTDENSKDFLRQVVYGLEHLPPLLALPVRALEHTATLDAGKGDSRRIRSYPASNAIRSGSFSHVHIDEWAAMIDSKKVWMAVEESIVPRGTCHALTTGVGGGDYTAEVWRAAERGESRFHPLFVGALERPDRQAEGWYEQKRRTTDAHTLRQELPLTIEDALSGGGDYRFDAEGIELCERYPRGLSECDPNRQYLIACDVGEKDGSVCVVLDVTADKYSRARRPVADVVGYELQRPTTILACQEMIERFARLYPRAPVVVESTGIGQAVIANLQVPQWRLHSYQTTNVAKPRLIGKLALAIQRGEVTWDPEEVPDLAKEIRSYKEPDTNIRQDSVMALGIGVDSIGLAWRGHGPGARVFEVAM